MAEPKFTTGDLVRLKSGGPVMTVDGYAPGSSGKLSCVWFEGSEHKRAAFRPEALVPAEAPSQ